MAIPEFNPGTSPETESAALASALSSATDKDCRRLTVGGGVSGGGQWGGPWRNTTIVPSLRLQGRWLDRAGFSVGAAVRVLVTNGRLVVELTGDTGRLDDCQVHDG